MIDLEAFDNLVPKEVERCILCKNIFAIGDIKIPIERNGLAHHCCLIDGYFSSKKHEYIALVGGNGKLLDLPNNVAIKELKTAIETTK
jgi:hypothetical protein